MLQSVTVWSCCGAGPFNYKGNEHATFVNWPIKRGREAQSTPRQQKHHISVNNNFHLDEAGQPGSVLNLNHVSTGLRLSYEEDELNSSISSLNGNMTTPLPVMLSLRDNLKAEIDRQKEEFDHYIRLQVIIRYMIFFFWGGGGWLNVHYSAFNGFNIYLTFKKYVFFNQSKCYVWAVF